ncbi:hypothetical protein TWF481_001836 [Arthrobotrys musiformis]|uniref:UDP-N-acetylmuramoyl-L-alanyl-D-glutamate synthetase n=1 Tax=Arthrobotrys musiformis TaxID=47236 RepID=A0AAV9VX96_9PEZI
MPNLVVLGGGESGVGTAILAQKRGYTVFLSDSSKLKPTYSQTLLSHHIPFEDTTHTTPQILSADIVMKSPGIPDTAPIVQLLLNQGTPVISEIEFTSTLSAAPTIGITGSNGKTTTTLLTHHLLTTGGLPVGIAGNIGKSYALQVANSSFPSYVLELSSFQLDGIVNYAPHIAVITNISPDHLDRYEYKYEKYIASKFRITMNQTEGDYLIYDADDGATANWLGSNSTKAQLIPFSVKRTLDEGAYLHNDRIIVKIDKDTLIIDTADISLRGKHNYKNSMVAVIIAILQNVEEASIRSGLKTFVGAEHRLEKVMNIEGVEYIDDSKATNVNSVFYALDSMTAPTVWIVGGVDKGNDYDEIMELVKEKVKAIVCLGVDNKKIIGTFGGVVKEGRIAEARNMVDAVSLAQGFAVDGETVLLSPACASFDLFKSYEDRGRQFKDAVRKLQEE